MAAVGLIPARLASSRLPGKLLLDATGQPLIQHTWEAACRASSLGEVIVATDSPEIAEAVRRFGGRAELTGEHTSGTDRIAEVVRRCVPRAEIIVNIQGDEPEIDPDCIDTLVETLATHSHAETATLATPIRSVEDLHAPSCVKVVCAADGRALYFSRSPIPFVRDADPARLLRGRRSDVRDQISEVTARPATTDYGPRTTDPHQSAFPNPQSAILATHHSPLTPPTPWLLHLGLYAYRREFLLRLTELPPSRLERLEKLEQLRVLEVGATMQVAVVDHRSVGIDTPEDYARFVARQRSRAA